MKNDLIVQLRIYKGRVNYDVNGNITSDHQPMKLKYGTMEWTNFLAAARGLGISKVEILGGFTKPKADKSQNFKEIDSKKVPKVVQFDLDELFADTQEAKDKVASARAAAAKETTEEVEEKKEEKVEEKVDEKTEEDGDKTEEGSGDDEQTEEEKLEDARTKYTELFGEKPHHAKGLKGLLEKIAEKEATN